MDHKGFGKGFVLGLLLGAGGALLAYKKKEAIKEAFWKFRARADFARRLRALKKVTKEGYEETVDSVVEHYRVLGSVAEEELEEFAQELKSNWKTAKQKFSAEMEEAK